MPGPYVHISSMWHTAEQFEAGDYQPVASDHISPDWAGADVAELSRLMRENPNFAATGAVGPDLFFFLPDFRDVKGVPVASVLIGVLDFLEHVYDTLDPYVSKWEHYLGPISEDTAEEMSRLTGGLSEFGRRHRRRARARSSHAARGLRRHAERLVGLLQPRPQQGLRRQGVPVVGHAALPRHRPLRPHAVETLAQDDAEGPRAYALGYLTHLATDVTGHAVVNAISGGPFRTHWQRHHLVENHIDAYWYLLDQAANAPAHDGRLRAVDRIRAVLRPRVRRHDGNAPVMRPPVPTGSHTARELGAQAPARQGLRAARGDRAAAARHDRRPCSTQGKPEPPHPLSCARTSAVRPTAGRRSELIQEAYDVLFRYLKVLDHRRDRARVRRRRRTSSRTWTSRRSTIPAAPPDENDGRLLGRPARLDPGDRLGLPACSSRSPSGSRRSSGRRARRPRRPTRCASRLYYTFELPLFYAAQVVPPDAGHDRLPAPDGRTRSPSPSSASATRWRGRGSRSSTS